MTEEGEIDLDLSRVPSCLHLVSAFLAMEPPHFLISLARDCGGGSVNERVQRFIWEHCLREADGKSHVPYLKSFLKKLIVEVESQGLEVLDELYERFAFFMTSLKDDDSVRANTRVLKCISFLFPDACSELSSCPKSRKLVVPLQCSLNMLEGDTGCSIWPSSLFLSEFILSCPEIFSNKSCFEVGSGVGLVGISLAQVKASKVMLSDGDLSSLANMKFNLELNQLRTLAVSSDRITGEPDLLKCIHLPWESAVGSELQDFMPDIILGADVIYDPLCLPHLVQVLALLLNREKSHFRLWSESCDDIQQGTMHSNDETHCTDNSLGTDPCQGKSMLHDSPNVEHTSHAPKEGPVVFIASVIRNIDTFNHFLALAEKANLNVEDVSGKFMLFNLLPYMQSYDQSSIRLFTVTHL